MMKTKYLYLFLFLCFGIIIGCQRKPDSLWPEVKKEMKPWTRWWWMGNAVDSTNIQALLREYQQKGFGGVEIAPIYGAKGYESQYTQHLSPKWMEKLHYTVKEADSLGMGVDLTNGTGWPFGGPQVDEAHAATKLIVSTYRLKTTQQLHEKIKSSDPKQPNAPLIALTAYGPDTILLTNKVHPDGTLAWTAPEGDWELYALFLGKTKQQVKRAAPGGEGFTLDHFSKEALQLYLQPYQKAFEGKKLGIRAFYNDSYEVYGADWSDKLLSTFEEKRGYNLGYYIRDLLSKDSTDQVARVKADYRLTVAEMLLENFTKPWTGWAHEKQAITKNQAHGSPGNLLDLYAAVDIPEAETFGSSYFPILDLRRDSGDIRNVDPDPMMLKFASSAAHVTGKKLVSSETFTWLTEHFKTSWAQCKPEVDQVFLSGINHVFYHGTTYSPKEAKWPGWLFYASVNFVPANSLWSHLDGLNQYITRVQSILQTGESDNELLLYWPVHDIWHDAKGTLKALKVHDIDEWLHPSAFYKQALRMQREGYAFDFVSDDLLNGMQVKGNEWAHDGHRLSYKTLLIPRTEQIPLKTLEKIIQLAKEGGTVVFQSLPQDVPGLFQLKQRRARLQGLLNELRIMSEQGWVGKGKIIIQEDFIAALKQEQIHGEAVAKRGLQFVRRKLGNTSYYYIANLSGKNVDDYIPVNVLGKAWYLLDPLSGRTGKALTKVGKEQTAVRLQLESGTSQILMVTDRMYEKEQEWKYWGQPAKEIDLTGTWQLRFQDGGPSLPQARTLHHPVLWTSLKDSVANDFSGKGGYRLTFELPTLDAKEYILALDSLYESARVKINGKEAGLIWSLPYKLAVGDLLQPGTNTIEIEVANLMANRMRYMDRNHLEWRAYHEINFVNIDYEPFDAAKWEVAPSGLGGKVKLLCY